MRELINTEDWQDNISDAEKTYSYLQREMMVAIINILYSGGYLKIYVD